MFLKSWVCVLLSVALLAGCGGSGPKLVPVEGTVALDGKSLGYKNVTFIPVKGTAGSGAWGFTNAEGRYSLSALTDGTTESEGCAPGHYRVVIKESTIPISEADFGRSRRGEKESHESPIAVGPTARSGKVNFPAIYTSSETTPLLLEVPEIGGKIHLELFSRPQ